MNHMGRRQFFKITGGTLAGSSMALLGIAPELAQAAVRQYKLATMKETRITCPYCTVTCGILIYTLGDGAKYTELSVMHIEGDHDHPVKRGILCPKGAGLVDFIHSPNRLKQPEYRAPGSDRWELISWQDAFERIARLMKEDRDENFVRRTEDGKLVNRWVTTGMLAASASSNEVGYITHKVIRSLGILPFDNQARV